MKYYIIVFILFSVCASSHAQYKNINPSRENILEDAKKSRDSADSFVGKRYWIIPNKDAASFSKRVFFDSTEDDSLSGNKFLLTESTSFTIESYYVHDRSRSPKGYARIVFEDGKKAFLETDNIDFRKPPYTSHPFFDVYELGQPKYTFIEYIYTISPAELEAVERKQRSKAATAAAAWEARGGVAIGMTAKQVRASNWGAPAKINRSTGSYGVHEQWVYSGNNYIYLENGIVTSIQN